MKISQMIKELEQLKEKHGDLSVCHYQKFMDGIYDGFYEVDTIEYYKSAFSFENPNEFINIVNEPFDFNG